MESTPPAADLLTSIINKFDLILGGIVTLLGKVAWDKRKAQKPLSISGDDVELSSTITPRDSVMIWLTDRVHKVREEVNAPIIKNAGVIEELRLRTAFLETDSREFKIATAANIEKLHDHIDRRSDKLEELIEKLREIK